MNKAFTTQRVVLTSFVVDLSDVVLNFGVSALTGSVVMLAQLIQGVSDLLASGCLLIGLKRPPKELRFWTFSSALAMLCIASTMSFHSGLQRFLHPEPIENILLAYFALFFSVATNGYAFFLSAQRIFRKDKDKKNLAKAFIDSPLLMTKNTFVLDLMGMSAALVGLIALVLYQVFGDLRFDGLGAMGIGVVLALLSVSLIWEISQTTKKKLIHNEL